MTATQSWNIFNSGVSLCIISMERDPTALGFSISEFVTCVYSTDPEPANSSAYCTYVSNCLTVKINWHTDVNHQMPERVCVCVRSMWESGTRWTQQAGVNTYTHLSHITSFTHRFDVRKLHCAFRIFVHRFTLLKKWPGLTKIIWKLKKSIWCYCACMLWWPKLHA